MAALILPAAGCASAPSPQAAAGPPRVSAPQASASQPSRAPAPTVTVEFFAMSQCPFCKIALDQMKGTLDLLGPSVTFSLDYVGTVGADGELASMHGPDEVTGDIAQVCAASLAPRRFMELVVCQNRDPAKVATTWEACAEEAGIPVAAMRACVEGEAGRQLLAASFARAAARAVVGTPTIYVNGELYSGKRGTMAFARAICAAAATKPAVCATVPEPPPVTVTILEDKRCTRCDSAWTGLVKTRVENPVVRQLDYGDPDGRALYDSLGDPALSLPLVLFDASLDADQDAAEALARWLSPHGAYRVIERGNWLPACADTNGCALARCRNTLDCRPVTPGKLEVFVMSQCPYAIRAMDEIGAALATFAGKVTLEVHFIGTTADDGSLSSMHGPGEVDEDMRELCAMKRYPKNYQWLEYVRCRNADVRSPDWEACATGGIDAKVIAACVKKEGRKLLGADFALAKTMGITGSPTWVANGRTVFHGVTADAIRRGTCEASQGSLPGCDALPPAEPGQGEPAGCGK